MTKSIDATTWLDDLTRPIPASALTEPYIAEARARCEWLAAQPLCASVPDLLAEAVAEAADRDVLHFIDENITLTYQELERQVAGLAGGMAAIGIGLGSHVGVMLPNIPEFPISWLAIARLGAVMVPINTEYTEREFDYAVRTADVDFLVTDASLLDGAASSWVRTGNRNSRLILCRCGATAPIPGIHIWNTMLAIGEHDFASNRPGPSDLLNIQFTSGTTGFPKGCQLTHEYWIVAGKVNAFRDGVKYGRVLASTPFYYMDPQWLLLMVLFQRGTLFVARKQSTTRFRDWLRDNKIQFCLFPQPLMLRPIEPTESHHELRRANIYGLRPKAHAAAERRFGMNLREAFGMTETGPVMFMPLSETAKVGSGSCGQPGPFRECRIIRDDGTVAKAGETGELQVRGRGIMSGYYGNPEATRSVMDGDWFRTGDLFRRDSDGFFYIIGRKKDMIRRSAENIPAREVEAVLMAIPEVAEVAAIPVPDAVRGEEVKVFIVPKGEFARHDLDPASLLETAAQELASFKVPRYVHFCEALPKTGSGKIKKRELAEIPNPIAGCWDRVEGIWQ